jgi:cell division protein FtsW (lipid II flippase)
MGLSALGMLIALLTMMTRQKAKMIFLTASLIGVTGFLIYEHTNFLQEFKGRVEQRKLDDRQLTEEKRFIEYSLLYDDMFVYHAYNPWTGYELFNSGGNYGKGIMAERSLHGDIPNLLHSSGLIGVILYLLMTGTAFWQAIKEAKRYQDKLIVLFCALTFMVYTITGRYTEIAATLLLFLVLMLPVAENEAPKAVL